MSNPEDWTSDPAPPGTSWYWVESTCGEFRSVALVTGPKRIGKRSTHPIPSLEELVVMRHKASDHDKVLRHLRELVDEVERLRGIVDLDLYAELMRRSLELDNARVSRESSEREIDKQCAKMAELRSEVRQLKTNEVGILESRYSLDAEVARLNSMRVLDRIAIAEGLKAVGESDAFRAEAERLRDALGRIRNIKCEPNWHFYGKGDVNMSADAKPYCAALGECVCAATEALRDE